MKTFIDNKLIQKITSETVDKENSLLKAYLKAGILTNDQPMQVMLGWPSLLEYLDLESLFENFPTLDNQNELFALIISTLPLESEKDFLIRLYDQVFVECLTHVKALPQIDPTFLIQRIQQKRQSSLKLFAQSLDRYERLLLEHPAHIMHDLILYLAWDRVCVNLAILFEYRSPEVDIRSGLDVLKECLLESFQHITAHGRTAPSLFRLMEALYAYQMREENLPIYTDSEWSILCQSACALKPREILSDVWYIDAAVTDDQKLKEMDKEKKNLRVLTMDSVDKVQACLAFVHYMIDKLKLETEWQYSLCPIEVVCLQEYGNDLVVNAMIND